MKPRSTLQRFVAASFIAVLPLAASAQAPDYPARPVTLVVGFAPGGSADILARIVAQKLSAQQQVGAHEAEVPGLAVHTFQRLRHPAPRSSVKSGLTLKITPVTLGEAGWEFKVSFDSMGRVPDDDLQAAAVLIVDGKEVKPTRWVTTRASSHHREGMLIFPVPASTAKAMEVRVQRPDESAARIFRWTGAELN